MDLENKCKNPIYTSRNISVDKKESIRYCPYRKKCDYKSNYKVLIPRKYIPIHKVYNLCNY